MRTISTKQAQEIDLNASQKLNMPTLIMMENAGIRIADFILRILKSRTNKKVAVFCGKGNNAGDGLVISRQLLSEAIEVDTFLLTPQRSLSFAARKNLGILKRMTKKIRQIRTEKHLNGINIHSYGLLTDAVFGIGLKARVEGIFKAAIQRINASKGVIVSVDVPSGLDANTGRVLGIAVRADYTLTLVAPKRGLIINQGPQYSGRIITRHIGFPLK
jgi:hydroxyethylthiazole kinase-like uncharacterized protein yjeF